MYVLLSDLKDYFRRQEITVDGAVFRIHCTFTTALLMAFSAIVASTQFVGTPIRCIINNKNLRQKVIDTYCWITSTFAMPDGFNQPAGSAAVAHPGVVNDYGDEGSKKYYSYYQWVCFVLFLQALLCYFPKFIWGKLEGNRMRHVVGDLNNGLCSQKDMNERNGILMDYLIRYAKKHNIYVFRYWFCELLCFLNVIFQMLLMNRFFNGDFMTYGLDVFRIDDEDQGIRHDHMVYVFPRVTKCTFRKYGSSGSIEKLDALCLLPLNIVNEKIYIFLWFWFILLAVLTLSVVIFRAFILLMPALRSKLLLQPNKMMPTRVGEIISRRVDVGDWWILHMLGRNVEPRIYNELMKEVAKSINLFSRKAKKQA